MLLQCWGFKMMLNATKKKKKRKNYLITKGKLGLPWVVNVVSPLLSSSTAAGLLLQQHLKVWRCLQGWWAHPLGVQSALGALRCWTPIHPRVSQWREKIEGRGTWESLPRKNSASCHPSRLYWPAHAQHKIKSFRITGSRGNPVPIYFWHYQEGKCTIF